MTVKVAQSGQQPYPPKGTANPITARVQVKEGVGHIHKREDRTLAEVLFPDTLPHIVAQINYVAVDPVHLENCPKHWHEGYWETFILLEGRLVVGRGDGNGNGNGRGEESTRLERPGGRVSVAPCVRHWLYASPGTRYLEVRSSRYSAEEPDKHFCEPEDEIRVRQLNREASFE